ncbi:sensor histidine kinase [Candidatus Omnitrophota bacterium]
MLNKIISLIILQVFLVTTLGSTAPLQETTLRPMMAFSGNYAELLIEGAEKFYRAGEYEKAFEGLINALENMDKADAEKVSKSVTTILKESSKLINDMVDYLGELLDSDDLQPIRDMQDQAQVISMTLTTASNRNFDTKIIIGLLKNMVMFSDFVKNEINNIEINLGEDKDTETEKAKQTKGYVFVCSLKIIKTGFEIFEARKSTENTISETDLLDLSEKFYRERSHMEAFNVLSEISSGLTSRADVNYKCREIGQKLHDINNALTTVFGGWYLLGIDSLEVDEEDRDILNYMDIQNRKLTKLRESILQILRLKEMPFKIKKYFLYDAIMLLGEHVVLCNYIINNFPISFTKEDDIYNFESFILNGLKKTISIAVSDLVEEEQAMVDVYQVLIEIQQFFQLEYDEFTIEVDESLAFFPKVYSRKTEIERVFRNLIFNAPIHGGVDFSKVKISGEPTEENIKITIEDNGVGIDSERGNIYDYANTDGEGSGMGLSSVKGLLRKYNATIRQGKSSELKGAKFTVTFPVNGASLQNKVSKSAVLNECI